MSGMRFKCHCCGLLFSSIYTCGMCLKNICDTCCDCHDLIHCAEDQNDWDGIDPTYDVDEGLDD